MLIASLIIACMSSWLLCQRITVNKPGCSSEAFSLEDKYLTCSMSTVELERCMNSSLVEGPLPVVSRVEWCFNNRTTCLSTNSSWQGSTTLPQLDVLANGTLYFHYVTFEAPKNKRIECSYYNSDGMQCSAPVFIDLAVHRTPGNQVGLTKVELICGRMESR